MGRHLAVIKDMALLLMSFLGILKIT